MSNVQEDGSSNRLSGVRVALWGFLGGLTVVAADLGLFNITTVSQFMDGAMPYVQLGAYFLSAVTIGAAGVVWSLINRPIYSEMVAFQLGTIAPAALTALLSAGSPATAADTEELAQRVSLSAVLISTASASETPDILQQRVDRPTILQCIGDAIVRRPC
jgi:hypothetical protein